MHKVGTVLIQIRLNYSQTKEMKQQQTIYYDNNHLYFFCQILLLNEIYVC